MVYYNLCVGKSEKKNRSKLYFSSKINIYVGLFFTFDSNSGLFFTSARDGWSSIVQVLFALLCKRTSRRGDIT